MIHFLHGADAYRREQRLRELIKAYQKKYAVFSVNTFDFEDEDEVLRFRDFCSQQTMFDNKKLAIITDAFSIKGSDEAQAILKSTLNNGNIIVFISEFTDENSARPRDRVLVPKDLLFLLNAPTYTESFDQLSDAKLAFFVSTEAKHRNILISPEAADFLVFALRRDTQLIMNELEKIALYYNDPTKELSRQDVESLIDYLESPDIFAFTNAVTKQGPIASKLTPLERLFINQEEPAKIFNIFAKNPFIDLATIKMLADYDILIKSGKLDYETAFVDICLK
jgi:DNA polymerase III delta subunit